MIDVGVTLRLHEDMDELRTRDRNGTQPGLHLFNELWRGDRRECVTLANCCETG